MTKHLSKPESDLLVVTAGEPAGIGPELCLSLADSPAAGNIVVIADPDMLADRARMIGSGVRMTEYADDGRASDGELLVIPQPNVKPAVCGKPDPANARSLLDGLERAVAGCRSGEFAGLVTAPLQKRICPCSSTA